MVKERDIENLLEQKLKKKGWNINFSDINRNVYHQKARTNEENEKLGGLEPDFCLYTSLKSAKPDIIIETKKPGMKLKQTKEQAERYAKILGSKIIIIYDGLQIKTYWTENSEPLIYNGVEVNEIESQEFYKIFIKNKSNIYQDNKILIESKQDLIQVFAFANKKLRKAGITKGMERFFEFSNLLFLKLISEENDIIKEEIPEYIKWEAYKNKEGEELLTYINDIVISKLENIFNKQQEETLFSKLIIKDNLVLKQIINKLDKLVLKDVKTDIKGDAFEYFIQQYNNSNNDLGEYFTPRHVVKFLVDVANPKYGEKVYDPFCGTGGILISAFNKIRKDLEEENILTKNVLNDLRENTIYGSEISSNAKITKMNMILTGDGHSNIIQQNTLENPVTEQYDVVITNIPFNLEGVSEEKYGLLSSDGNTQSIEHIIRSLNRKTTARAYVISPESVLNNSETKKLRKFLLDNNLISEIISLPSGIFLPYTESKSSILVLKGFNTPKVDKIKYSKIKSDGYTLTQRRRKISNKINDLEEYLANGLEHNFIEYSKVYENKNLSLIGFRYFKDIPDGYIQLSEVVQEEKIKNTKLYETATITNKEFFGIVDGENYWGENFVSVTSDTNDDYKVVNKKSFAYNPSRANVGSIAINVTDKEVAVSKMYVTFKVVNKNFLPEYVYLYLKSPEGIQEIKDRSFGSVRQALRFDDLCTIGIPIISLKEQERIINKILEKYKMYEEYKKNIKDFDLINEIK
jgi:type I restriction enzyme M protein